MTNALTKKIEALSSVAVDSYSATVQWEYASDIGLQLSANTKIMGTVPLVTDALVKMMGASTTVADDLSANGTNGCYEKQCCQPTKLNKS